MEDMAIFGTDALTVPPRRRSRIWSTAASWRRHELRDGKRVMPEDRQQHL